MGVTMVSEATKVEVATEGNIHIDSYINEVSCIKSEVKFDLDDH